MFTGIVEAMARVEKITPMGTNLTFTLHTPLAASLRVDQSLLHNGVCLTVEEVGDDTYRVTAIKETIDRSNLGHWKVGDRVNLERSVRPDSFLDGHLVQGHVDTVSECLFVHDRDGSWEFGFGYDSRHAGLLVHKGSICLDGISLTIASLDEEKLTVAIIPYTFENTNFGKLQPGMAVNVEFDILGKYILRYLESTGNRQTEP